MYKSEEMCQISSNIVTKSFTMPKEKYQKKDAHIYFKDMNVRESVSKLALKEKRTFSDMVIILCEEAINQRIKKQNVS